MNTNDRTTAPQPDQGFLVALIHGLFLLFFLQCLTDFIAAVYAFGLLGTSIPPEIASVLFLFSPIILIVVKRRLSHRQVLVAGELFLLCRVIEPLLDTRGRMLTSGLGVAVYLILLPAWLQQAGQRGRQDSWRLAGAGLVIAILSGYSLRAFNSGVDLSTWGWGNWIGWLLALGGGILWARWQSALERNGQPTPTEKEPMQPLGFGRLAMFCLGLMGCLVLLYFGFFAPNVLARWVDLSYTGILASLSLVFTITGLVLVFKPGWINQLNPGIWALLNLLFALTLVGSILAAQVALPADPAAYPLYADPLPTFGSILFWIALFLSPVIAINFVRYWQEIVASRSSTRQLAGGFCFASLFLLVMVFANVFTTVYDYIPVIGPFFRDKYWLVYLLAWTGMALPLLGIRSIRAGRAQPERIPGPFPSSSPLVFILLGIAPVIGALLGQPTHPEAAAPGALKVLTYNLQQGYSEFGQKNYAGQLAIIRALNPDVVGLEETDTNRIAGGNDDLVRYLADNLNYYAYYGPSTVTGTFGIALLSRYPILESATFFMYSQAEQTATISAQIQAGDQRYHLFVTHLGNGGPIVQQQAVLNQVEQFQNVILMGDFNFRPDTEAYALTTQSLTDSWLAIWPDGVDGSGIDPSRRIDHIFVSPGTDIQDSRFLLDPASDHPALMTTLGY